MVDSAAYEDEVFAFPLSFAQQRLWFLDRLDPGSAAYNLPLLVRLRGRLDVDALERTIQLIVARHEVLRTTFSEVNGEPQQEIHPEIPLSLTVTEIPAGANSDAEMQRLMLSEVNRPFDLRSGPLIRAGLLRLADADHVLMVTLHHIVSDGWSMGVFFRELSHAYAAYHKGGEPRLPELSIQYADFTIWQRELLQGERLESEVEHWRGRLSGAPELLDLPTDHPRPAIQSDAGAHCRTAFPSELLAGLKELSQREGTTVFMTLLAAFNALLHRYTGQEDIVVGSPIANRARVELEPLIGFFANTLVLRTSLEDNPSFRELLQRTKDVTLDAYAHQDLPFEQLVAELNPGRQLSHSPLFQVMFTLQNAIETRLELPDLTLHNIEIERGRSKFDLALFMSETADGLRVSFEYSTDLFEEATILRMLTHLRTVLEAVVDDPDCAVGDLPLLSAEERSIISGWNRTERPYPEAAQGAHIAVEEQVERSPEAPAVRFGDLVLSYRELNDRANRLAHRLREIGVGPDVPVGICLRRSPDLAVSVLAVLKAGGAYAPLDPAYPPERLGFMIDDLGTPVLLTEGDLVHALPEHSAHVLCLDRADEDLAGYATANPEPTSGPENLAYVLFTSGSTGRPKGVAMPHRTLTNLISWQLRDWSPPSPARALQFASLSFDVAFQELFSTWWSGGVLVMVDEDTRRDPEALLRLLDAERVERLFLPYIALQNLTEASLHLDIVPQGLREVITAGEALQATDAIRRFFELSGAVLHNHYGPTESHVVTAFRLEGPPSGWADRPPIGKPIDNARIEILDRYGNQVPVGVPGELHIGGPVLARGYFDRPELTSERFVDDPFAPEPGGRLYRTGDFARYQHEGTVEYLGRVDEQVKLRGYRVELGEIEAELRRHGAVGDAVAVVREEQQGQRLVAYTLPKNGEEPASDELRAFLRRSLPEFMIPSAFVSLDAFPVSPNGKLDRRALPAPEQAGGDETVEPRDEDELKLVEIWRDLLGLDRPCGVHDDFFELGGHSLLAVRVFARIEEAFGIRLPLALLFQEATVASLAVALRREREAAGAWLSLVPIRPSGTRTPLFLVQMLTGEVLAYRDLVRYLHHDQPVYGLQAAGLDRRRYPRTTIEEMAADYVAELRGFQPEGPYLLGGFCFAGVVAYEMARQLEQQGLETALVALIDASPFGHSGRIHGTRPRPPLSDLLRKGRIEWLRTFKVWARWKARKTVRWAVFDALVRARLPLPARLWNVDAANRRAMARYVTPASSCRVTLFRRAGADGSYFGASFWGQLAQGGVDVRPVMPVGDDDYTHNEIVQEPHVQSLAAELNRCLTEIREGRDSAVGGGG